MSEKSDAGSAYDTQWAKKDGKKVVTKRTPRMPKAGFTVKKAEVLTRAPVPYDPIY